MSKWSFKKGKREEGFYELDTTLGNQARLTPGFRGVLSLLSKDDPNVGIVITLWNDEESLKASQSEIFRQAIKKIAEVLVEPPTVQDFRLFTAELRALNPP